MHMHKTLGKFCSQKVLTTITVSSAQSLSYCSVFWPVGYSGKGIYTKTDLAPLGDP
jgi:hypothetical protein